MIVIRLKKTGTHQRKQWRVIVADCHSSTNGRLIEELGCYNPLAHPPELRMQMERYHQWIQKGAQPSETVRSLIHQGKKSVHAN